MLNRWNDADAARHTDALAQRVYTSRLIGQEPMLVLHGGGNTSVKTRETDLFGDAHDVLSVKSSGSSLEHIEASDFVPLRLAPLVRLTTLPTLTDEQWLNALKGSALRFDAPSPSVEALLHAIIPHRYVDHAHPDALLAVGSTPGGAERLRDIYGDTVVIVPYVRSGFPIARACAEHFARATSSTQGMILLNHGLFTFGDTAQQSYERMIALVTQAEAYLAARNAWHIAVPPQEPPAAALRTKLAALRRELSEAAGFPLIVATHSDDACLAFARRSDVADISQLGPATPDHVIRTKNRPQLGAGGVQTFRAAYEAYFARHAEHADRPLTMLDPAPRVILDPAYGMLTTGRTAKDARIASDIYRNTMDIILRATALEAYQALSEQDIFAMEYWSLEQAKLRLAQQRPVFTGEVALVTGAASGIGKACVHAFMARGAAVVGLDLNPAIETMIDSDAFLGIVCNVTDEAKLCDALEQTARTFGGLDMLVLNAGMFPGGTRIAELPSDMWRRVMAVNLDANLVLLRESHPLLKLAPQGGRVAVIGSKNVPAPGPGAAAYSASKAALNQLARVAALEWGKDGIRINTLHPDAVFDTGLWSEEVLQARAQHYGLTVEQYKRKNVLGTEVSSSNVADLAAELCGPLFRAITGAQLPIDGGNERVI